MAFLKALSLRGFKTFARPTELVFERGVTVIIGPNGSGKSNLADAVLWALGEQSPTALRGKSMQDVLFSGSDGHGPSSSAEVSLLFENSCGSFPGGYSEVEITRRLTRDGQSEYFLNGIPRRLLDIQELCAAVGLGREMHSVISQGRVEELLGSSPAARRALLEEAAGLTLYKKRRERALAKLERVTADLMRLGDVEREVRAALRPLKQQVNAAEANLRLSEQIARLEALLLTSERSAISARLDVVTGELERLSTVKREYEAELDANGREREQQQARFTLTMTKRETESAQLSRIQSEARRLAERSEDLSQRLARWEGEAMRLDRRRSAEVIEFANMEVRADALQATVERGAKRQRRVQEMAKAIVSQLADLRPQVGALWSTVEEKKDLIVEAETRRSKDRQRMELLTREQAQTSRRREEAALRRSSLQTEVADLTAGLRDAEQSLGQANARLESVAGSAEAAARAAADAQSRLDCARHALRGREDALSSADARLSIAQDTIARREGLPEGAQALLRAEPSARPLVEALTVKAGFERAVTAALGLLSQAVVVEKQVSPDLLSQVVGGVEIVAGEAAHGAGVASVSRAEEVARPSEFTPAATSAEAWSLWEVVKCAPALRLALTSLLPNVVIVEDLATAAALSPPGAGMHGLVVTKSGEVLSGAHHGARRSAPGPEVVLKAGRLVAELTAEVERLQEEMLELRASVAKAENDFRTAQEREETLEKEAAAARAAAVRAERELDALGRRLAGAREHLEQTALQERHLQAAASALAAEVEDLSRAAADADGEAQALREQLRAEEEKLAGVGKAAQRLEGKRTQASVLQARLEERLRAHHSEVSRLKDRQGSAQVRLAGLEARRRALDSALPVVQDLLAVTSGLVTYAEREALAAEAAFARSRDSTRVFGDLLRQLADRESHLEAKLSALTDSMVELQVERARLHDSRALLTGRLEELCERHLEPRSVTPEEAASIDVEKVRRTLEHLGKKREALGPINALADREYKETSERLGFLTEQREDLENSLSELRRIVRDLDSHIARVFADFFADAARNFGEMVETLFPGGRGELRLEQGVSDESAGIEIIIKLPNKAPRTLTLLSGGEKALAALAFLFALFLAHPCPFYILDEVDAALDDINIARFLSLVRRYQNRTQFLIVSHQRRTMEVADVLYGVAMGPDGVSRVLSRRLTCEAAVAASASGPGAGTPGAGTPQARR